MLPMNESPVMDVLPWPSGHGFTGVNAWWDYVMTKEERQRLDNLMGLALLDENVCDRLIIERDETLMKAFGLSTETQTWLRGVEATSLTELAQAIISGFEAFLALLLFWRFNIARVMLLWGMPFVVIGITVIYMDINRAGVSFWVNYIKLAWYAAYAFVYTRPALVHSFKSSY
mgnify:CR=1 FL=1